MTITDVYLQETHFNPTCNATIPGAWVAVVNGITQAFAGQFEHDTIMQATIAAKRAFS